MAIYHLNAKIISRAAGRSATAAAAYRSGAKIVDVRTGLAFNYSKRKDVSYRTILAPADAPDWALARDKLWNACEKAERRKDAQVAREIEVALPLELSRSEHIRLLRRFVREQFVGRGMVADLALHAKKGNPHAHILLTTRELNTSSFGPKARDWNDVELLKIWREQWGRACNASLERAGLESRIDHRSLAAQGVPRTAGSHLGPAATAIDQAGRHSYRVSGYITTKENEMKEALQQVRKDDKAAVQVAKKRLAMPPGIMVVDLDSRHPYNVNIREREYVRSLVETFQERCTTIQEVKTRLGQHCQRFELPNGLGVYDCNRIIHTDSSTEFEVTLMLQLAKHKGWEAIFLMGPEEYKRAVWLAAVMEKQFENRPDRIGGYLPTQLDREVVRGWLNDMRPPEEASYEVLKTHGANAQGSFETTGHQGSKSSSSRP